MSNILMEIIKEVPKDVYIKILDSMPIVCIDVVIKNKKDEILWVYRKNHPAKGEWWIPGGRVYKMETLENAAIRKIKEETGLDIIIQKKIGVYETMFEHAPFSEVKSGVHTVNICFLASAKNEEVILDSQSEEYKWSKEILTNNKYINDVLKDSGM